MLLLAVTARAVELQHPHLIKPHRLMELIREGSALWVIDVRPARAFERGHIEGAVHIPFEQLKTKALPDGKLLVLVDDRLGLTAAREAADLLQKKGHNKLFVLEGGMPLWEAERLPVAGTAFGRVFRQLLPKDLARTGEFSKEIKLYDLRDTSERARAVIQGAEVIAGATLKQRLLALHEKMSAESGKGITARLEPSRLTVLLFPVHSEPEKELERCFSDLAGDIRYLSGGHIEAQALQKSGKKNRIGGCSTCPGGR